MASDQADLDALIDEKINQLIKNKFDRTLEKHNQDNTETPKIGEVVIQFLDKKVTKSKKKTGWFGQGKSSDSEDLKSWESWTIKVKCLPVTDDRSSEKSVPDKSPRSTSDKGKNAYEQNVDLSINSFENNVRKVIDIADTHKDHIPPITSLESSPFPYTIKVEQKELDFASYTATEEEGWGNYIKKMLD